MKLTSREKIMLIILGIIATLAASYFLILKPQLEKIDMLTIEQETVKQKVDEVKKEIASGGKLKESFEQEDKRIEELSTRFYPEIFQPKLIEILDSLIDDTGIKVGSLDFTPRSVSEVATIEPAVRLEHPSRLLTEGYKLMTGRTTTQGAIGLIEDIATIASATEAEQANTGNSAQSGAASALTENMTIDIQYSEATYEQVTAFINGLEAQNRTIIVNNLNMEDTGNNKLSGTLSVTFYALPKLYNQDGEYLDWPYNNLYGKNNPFEK